MIKAIFTFLVLFGIFFVCIKSYRNMTKREKWNLSKHITFSLLCASLTTIFLIIFVILF